MNKQQLELQEYSKLILGIAELNNWEVNNMPFMSTMTGRLIYFLITNRISEGDFEISNPIKELVGTSGYTSKAIRVRLNKMEEDGFVVMTKNSADSRSKYPKPTELFYAAMFLHARQVRHIFNKDFVLFEK